MERTPRTVISVNGRTVAGEDRQPQPIEAELVVNGETISDADVAAEVQNHSAPRGHPGVAWRKAARAVVVQTLLLQEAHRRGLRADPQPVGPGRIETDEDALVRGLLDEAVDVPQPSETEIRAEWGRDPDRFRSPPLWEISHILCACDPADEAERSEVRRRAERVTAEAHAHPERFAALATRDSDCGSRAAGGALGQLGPGDTVPEFEAAVRALSQGEITPEPVLTRFGWHVIRLDALAEGHVLPFDAVRDKVADAMEKAAWARAVRAFVEELVASADISGVTFDEVGKVGAGA